MSSEGKPSSRARGDPDGECPNWPSRSRRDALVGDDEADGRPLPEGLNLGANGEDWGVESCVESCSSYGLFRRGTMMLGGAPEAYFGRGALSSGNSRPPTPWAFRLPFAVPAGPVPLSFARVVACREATGSVPSSGGRAAEGIVKAPDAFASGLSVDDSPSVEYSGV